LQAFLFRLAGTADIVFVVAGPGCYDEEKE